MGIRPEKHQDLLHDTSLKPASGHDVLVDNFLNAQCMLPVTTEDDKYVD